MYETPRVALARAVEEGKMIAENILQLQLRVAAKHITEDVAVEEYEKLLRRVETVKGLAERAQAAMLELAPPILSPRPPEMTRGMAELRVLAAEQKRDPMNREVSKEIARVNGTLIMPAAQAWYSQATGSMGVLVVDAKSTECLSAKRVVTMGAAHQGVQAAGIEMPVLD